MLKLDNFLAIMVLFTVIVEYKLNNITLRSINKKVAASTTFRTAIKLTNSKYHNNISRIADFFVVLGTLIWGYGNFIVK